MDTRLEHHASQTSLGFELEDAGVRDTGVVDMMDGSK